ncbi:MAG: 3-deoxy-manno-octulosonate cytidylyltransferase [Deltaproteobacteria bacterium]|nr:3-deoxy-manno-octulosonate cytidylyltransferase [Deltaproteobacteria bacterium]MBW2073845.1 3-deoxy-manno-octulosonate cytidylyltransferase [Deltaproteobacteria bacterium]RLB83146.1 MAG: 3-deoxy-manno-octulosonate cytidylyltransferase [Deltaproteobacteria bacterium]
MKIVAIIPCRYGSKRFEGKPLMAILGKPMIQWVYEKAKQAAILTDVVIATDDERIYRCVQGFGGRVLMTAPTHRSGSDRAAEAAQALGLKDEDIVINIQGDQPAFDPRCLPEVVSPLLEDSHLVMSTLIYKISDPAEINDPNHVKCVFDKDHFALYFSRSTIPCSRDGAVSFDIFKHLGIYAYRKHFLDCFASLPQGRLEAIEKLEQLRAMDHGYRIKVVETRYDSKEVDTPADIGKLEMALRG